ERSAPTVRSGGITPIKQAQKFPHTAPDSSRRCPRFRVESAARRRCIRRWVSSERPNPFQVFVEMELDFPVQGHGFSDAGAAKIEAIISAGTQCEVSLFFWHSFFTRPD